MRIADGSNWVSLSICPPNVGISFYILGQPVYIQNDLPQRQRKEEPNRNRAVIQRRLLH